MTSRLPPTFSLGFRRVGAAAYELAASQVLPLPRERAFVFFEDPRNLFDITPGWLSFIMQDRRSKAEMFDGAEFDYTIRWFGIPLRWRSRIEGYVPPERFTDVQLVGPYRVWRHLHLFEQRENDTVMHDRVLYRLPLGLIGDAVHALAVRRQLEDIFRYRALRIDEWTRGVLRRRT